MSATHLLLDALADAEAEVAEVRQLKVEVTKLRRLLVVKLCDCRPLASTLPLEPVMHNSVCRYRKALEN
jgi:hypothetical protein